MWYRHYKGGRYEWVCEAKLESDPSITLVIYRSAEGVVWARPKDIFFQKVLHHNQLVDRFQKMDE